MTARLTLIAVGALFEFSIIALFTLITEQAPQARATVLSLVGLGISMGMGLGSPVTVGLWQWGGLGVVCGVAAIGLAGASALVWRGLSE